MAYEAIANGARGLMYFGGTVAATLNEQDTPLAWNWTFWNNVLKPVVKELGDYSLLAGALVASNSTLPITISGTTFPDRPLHPGDLDICAVTATVTPEEREPAAWHKDPTTRPARIYAAQNAISDDSGIPFDTTYLLESETAQGEPPHDAFNRHRRLTCWAISRAHWLAGQYVHLHGLRPEELVVAPTAAELRLALDRELEHLERHVPREGKTNQAGG